MNTIMVVELKVLIPYGLSLIYILTHSVIFLNEPTDVSNSSKGVPIPCSVPPLQPRWGLGRDIPSYIGHLIKLLNQVSHERRLVAHHDPQFSGESKV